MRSIYGLGFSAAAFAAMASLESLAGSVVTLPEAPSSGTPNHHRKINRSKYMPHQGKRECARRVRQMEARA